MALQSEHNESRPDPTTESSDQKQIRDYSLAAFDGHLDYPDPNPSSQKILRLQRQYGNAYVRRLISSSASVPRVQRDDPDRLPAEMVSFRSSGPRSQQLDPQLLRSAQQAIRARFGSMVAGAAALSPSYRHHFHVMTESAFNQYAAGSGAERPQDVMGANQDGAIMLRAQLPYQFQITLIHEILHSLDRSGLSTGDGLDEAMTQYLALWAADGHVNRNNVARSGSYQVTTNMLTQLVGGVPGLTAQVVAQYYLQGNATFNSILATRFGGGAETLIRGLFNEQYPQLTERLIDSPLFPDNVGAVLSGLINRQFRFHGGRVDLL